MPTRYSTSLSWKEGRLAVPTFPFERAAETRNVPSSSPMVAWTMGQHVSLLLEGSQRGK